MRRLVLAFAIAACRGEAPPVAVHAAPIDAAPIAPRPDAPIAVVGAPEPPPPPGPLITGIHGESIRALAVTDDGLVAVSADVGGAVRLWPALDGTREPVVVAATPPVALAIEADGDDVAFAGLDAAGALEIVRT